MFFIQQNVTINNVHLPGYIVGLLLVRGRKREKKRDRMRNRDIEKEGKKEWREEERALPSV